MLSIPFSDALPFQRDPLGFLLERGSARPGPLARVDLGFSPVFILTDPGQLKPIMRLEGDGLVKGALVEKLRPAVSDSMLVLNGPEHARRRTAMHSVFGRQAMIGAVPALSATIRATAGALAGVDRFAPSEVCPGLALRLVATVLFGEGSLTSGDEQILLEAINLLEDDIASSFFSLPIKAPWTAAEERRRRAVARGMIETVVERVRARSSASATMRVLQELELTASEVRDEITMLLLAGHHTTGSAAAWLLFLMAKHPQVLSALRSEAASLTDEGGEIDGSQIGRATVSLALVRETLRLWPSSWFFSRQAVRDIDLGQATLPSGATLIISPWLFHRSPQHWEAPEEFRMDRDFTNPAFVPFGVGPRACFGMQLAVMELQLLALEIASAFDIERATDAEPGMPKPMVTLQPPRFELSLQVRGVSKRRMSRHAA
ncbi:MAG: cytochrome P450 [Rhizobiales bacterium]|nr:cytochrome P450 [Hyphomicrobiales bacterium]